MKRLLCWLRRRWLSKVRIPEDKPSSQEEANAALERSQKDLEEIRQRRPRSRSLVGRSGMSCAATISPSGSPTATN